MKNKILLGTKNEWELPENPRDIDEDLPLDRVEIVETATISKDSNGQFFVRFPREIAEVLNLEAGFSLEFIVRKDIKPREENSVNQFSCIIIRKIKRRKNKKKAVKNAIEKSG